MNGLIQKVSLTDKLNSAGYTIIRTITVENDRGEQSLKYLKGYDSNGIGVYILLDIKDAISVSSEGRFIVKGYSGESRVLSDTGIAALKRMGDASGIAFECQDELCMMVRNNNLSIETPVFRVYDPIESAKIISLEEGVSAYPLLRVSEILVDPEGTMERTKEVALFIFERNIDIIKSENIELLAKLKKLPKVIDTFTVTSRNLSKKINDQNQLILEKMEENSDDSLRRNVYIRNHLNERIFSAQKQIYGLYPKIVEVIREVDAKLKILQTLSDTLESAEDPSILSIEDIDYLLRL